MLNYTAQKAYLKWCELNVVLSIYDVINDAIADGEGYVEFDGFIPPCIQEQLVSEGYRVTSTHVETLAHPYKICRYIIQWAPGEV